MASQLRSTIAAEIRKNAHLTNPKNRSDAQKALNKNGMQMNGVVIVGVKPVDPIQRQALSERLNNQGFMILPPAPSSKNLESKPLRASPYLYYLQNGSNSTQQSGGTIAIPAKSMASKIMDLMFLHIHFSFHYFLPVTWTI